MKKISFLNYLITLAIMTVVFGIVYATVQQNYRTAANDPQIQIARDINVKLQHGKSIENFFTDTIDIAQSLAIFTTLCDADGKPIRSSGFLDDKMPQLPAGVFNYARSHGEYEVTWQPESGVRMAMVIVSSKASPVGFIMSGRSLLEVEIREHDLTIMVFSGWIVCVGLMLLFAGIQFYKRENK